MGTCLSEGLDEEFGVVLFFHGGGMCILAPADAIQIPVFVFFPYDIHSPISWVSEYEYPEHTECYVSLNMCWTIGVVRGLARRAS